MEGTNRGRDQLRRKDRGHVTPKGHNDHKEERVRDRDRGRQIVGVNLRASFRAKISALFQNRDSSPKERQGQARISESVILKAHWGGRIYPNFQVFWTIVFIIVFSAKKVF